MFDVVGGCKVPQSDEGGEDTLNGGSGKLDANFQGDFHHDTEKEHPLVSLIDDEMSVIVVPINATVSASYTVDEKWGDLKEGMS